MTNIVAEEAGPDVREQDLVAARGAIALVASGVAIDIIFCGLPAPEAVAALLVSESLAAGVPVAVEPGGAGLDLVVGPREA